jgi:hypothetical protein
MMPAKMAKPPNVGTLFLCNFLLAGSSKRCFNSATSMMDGMDKKVTKNENANAKAGNKNLLLSK